MTQLKNAAESRVPGQDHSVQIAGIEQANHTIYMCVNGFHVTAVFREMNNKDIYHRVKETLIDSLIHRVSASNLT